MIAVICLAIAAALLFWPEPKPAPEKQTEPVVKLEPAPAVKPVRKRTPKNVNKK